jgi:hypothetical protein
MNELLLAIAHNKGKISMQLQMVGFAAFGLRQRVSLHHQQQEAAQFVLEGDLMVGDRQPLEQQLSVV